MAPTILVVGATGNTGRSVVQTLSKLRDSSPGFQSHRILAVTRTLNSKTVEQLSQLPGVEFTELHWVEITSEWLREHSVSRAFIASHNEPHQFADESQFLVSALQAGVEYVVRISTTAATVKPDNIAYYPRAHWAIEALLSSPEFARLSWTSLQPSLFTTMYLADAAQMIKSYRQNGQLGTLKLLAPEHTSVSVVDPDDVGILAAHLLLEKDVSSHNKAKYVVNGPEDISGRQTVEMVEELIGVKVQDVRFKDTSIVDAIADQNPNKRALTLSIKNALESLWAGQYGAPTTSKEILKIAAPQGTPVDVMKTLLKD